jgi:hypothetical protein
MTAQHVLGESMAEEEGPSARVARLQHFEDRIGDLSGFLDELQASGVARRRSLVDVLRERSSAIREAIESGVSVYAVARALQERGGGYSLESIKRAIRVIMASSDGTVIAMKPRRDRVRRRAPKATPAALSAGTSTARPDAPLGDVATTPPAQKTEPKPASVSDAARDASSAISRVNEEL